MSKKILSLVTILVLTASLLTGFSSKSVSTNVNKNSQPSKVSFWYLWTGDDAKIVEKIIADFNKSQSKYVVKGLSVPDVQKQITAIASGTGPDVTDGFSTDVASNSSKGIMLSLDNYINKTKFTKDFLPSSIKTCTANGHVWALPLNAGNDLMMFYNKKLLKAAGYNRAPKTVEEMIDVANKTTKLDAKGNMTVMGFPDFPFVYFTNDLAYALGAKFISNDKKTLTPDDPVIIKTLKYIRDYRKKWGLDKIQKFTAASGGYVSPTDPFVVGTQALRFDGPWLVNIIKNYNKNLDYGIAPLPYPKGHPELLGRGLTNASTMFIPSRAKNKDGAWAFMQYICGPKGMKTWSVINGAIPAIKSLWNDPEIKQLKTFKEFSKIVNLGKREPFPAFPAQAEYSKALGEQYELIANGKISPEAGMKKVKNACKDLLKQK